MNICTSTVVKGINLIVDLQLRFFDSGRKTTKSRGDTMPKNQNSEINFIILDNASLECLSSGDWANKSDYSQCKQL